MYYIFIAFGIIQIVLQVLCIIHVIKTGRNTIWIWVLIWLPVAGLIAYFFVEILPVLTANNRLGKVHDKIADTIIPARKIKMLEDQLEHSDTINNRLNLADAYLSINQFEKAIELYRSSLKGVFADDPQIMTNLAIALFNNEDFKEAIEVFEKVKKENENFQNVEDQLCYSQCLYKNGEIEKAENEFKLMCEKFSSIKAECSYGIFLDEIGKKDEAIQVFQEIVKSKKHMPGYTMKNVQKWIRIAEMQLNKAE